jgi:pyruvate dehydrogenase E1 component
MGALCQGSRSNNKALSVPNGCSTVRWQPEQNLELISIQQPLHISIQLRPICKVRILATSKWRSDLHTINRWNAMMLVTRANKYVDGLEVTSPPYASVSHLWEVGLNHFYRGKDGEGWGDHVYWQGHASPGIYARAWLEGRLSDENMNNFRQEVGGEGLSSYPHPRLMPSFWEYPSVSMGLGAMTAIHQARFNRYLHHRGLADTTLSRVWYTMGDGESDEPESLSELALAAREGLDNIVMTMNCNLQRLDGPVRGNSKIVQELEGRFRGAGWNVIKVLWGSSWDALFARDTSGILAKRLAELVDGDEQRLFTAEGAVIRKELFAGEALTAMVADYSDEELEALTEDLGGHDFHKIHAGIRRGLRPQRTTDSRSRSNHQGIRAWTCLCWPKYNSPTKESRREGFATDS